MWDWEVGPWPESLCGWALWSPAWPSGSWHPFSAASCVGPGLGWGTWRKRDTCPCPGGMVILTGEQVLDCTSHNVHSHHKGEVLSSMRTCPDQRELRFIFRYFKIITSFCRWRTGRSERLSAFPGATQPWDTRLGLGSRLPQAAPLCSEEWTVVVVVTLTSRCWVCRGRGRTVLLICPAAPSGQECLP